MNQNKQAFTDLQSNGGQARLLTQEQQLAIMRAQLEQQLHQRVEQNKQAFTDLQRRGINFDPVSLIGARIDSLIQSIANAFGPQGHAWAVQVRLDWENAVAEQLSAADQQGTKAQLAVGGQFTPGMIRQLARETNTFGEQALREAAGAAGRGRAEG